MKGNTHMKFLFNFLMVIIIALLITVDCIAKSPVVKASSNDYEQNEVKLIKHGGVYEVPVILNNVLSIHFILDSGASDVSISPDVALTLIRTKTIRKNDWLPGIYYKFADGSSAKSTRFKLKSVKIGNKELTNVTCSIANSMEAPMLLGQSALQKLGRYSIDYKRMTITFNSKKSETGQDTLGTSEIDGDERFIANSDGTVLDKKTNLMWAAKDNGKDIDWSDAKRYCETYRGGGYSDWRISTQDELAGLYDAKKSRPGACNTAHSIHVATELIDITCFNYWAGEIRNSDAPIFFFHSAARDWTYRSVPYYRVLPVRDAN